ncbi:hypothetical protein [Bradyrhizobium sp. USDA 4506]
MKTAEDRQRIREFYSLPADFDFVSLDNCLPSCAACNRRKSNRVFDSSPALILMLSSVRMNARMARIIAEPIERDEAKAKILVRIEAALTKGDITREDIEALFAGLPTLVRKTLSLPPAVSLRIAPGWEVIEERDHLVIVASPNGRSGITSKSGDPSWICPSCGSKGPWNGVICLCCGRMSDPND